MFVTLAYTGNVAATTTNFDLTALVDADFSQRNGHYVFTEEYNMIGACAIGSGLSGASLLCPTWNAFSKMNVYPEVISAQPVTSTYPDIRADWPSPVPLNEEFQAQSSNSTVAAHQQNMILWFGTKDWSRNYPTSQFNLQIRCTVSYTGVAFAWSGPAALVFEQSLRGGVYAVVGCDAQSSGAIAHRLIFPRQRLYQGRKLRPGNLTQNNFGDFPPLFGQYQGRFWGEWGRFHTFEPAQIEFLQNNAGAATAEVRLHLCYLGTDVNLLNSGSITI